MCCRCCSVLQQKFWVFGLGTISIVVGIVTVILWPDYITEAVANELPLTPCSRTYDKWAVTPIPIYNNMYLFNWTNAAEAYNPNVKPHFEMVGPYVFREQKVKEDITWHTNKTVTYYANRTWFFEPEMSNGTLEDLVTCPHLPSIAASNAVRYESSFIKFFFNNALNSNGGALYQTHTAIEWLFDGFYDEFLDYAMSLDNEMTSNIVSNHFAWFLNRNGSKDFEGSFNVHTGQGNLQEMGELKFWNGKNHTGFYEGNCGRINGSTADLFVPNREEHEYITIFVPDTCRIINLVPTGELITVEGIEGLKYETKPDAFDNGQMNPDMKCYCPAELQPDNCPKTGATNMSSCADGAPMFMSHSHFMWADPHYADTITGMNPNYERDNFYIIMERTMGIPLDVNAVVQVSLLVQQDKDITIMQNIQDFYAPLFVTNSKGRMTPELAREVKVALMLPDLGIGIGITSIVIGCIIILTGIYLTWAKKWYGQQMKIRTDEQENEPKSHETHEERTRL